MAANVESMFYVRQAPWHGLGVRVEAAPSSEEALRLSGLDWNVIQQPIKTRGGVEIPGYKANLRDVDNQVLGVVTDRYRVVQNAEAFAFTDALLGEGVKYETAGSLQNGRKIWLSGQAPRPVHHRGGPGGALPGVQQLPRWQRVHQGGHDPRPGGVPEYLEPGPGLRQAGVVYHPCGGSGREDGRGPQHAALWRRSTWASWGWSSPACPRPSCPTRRCWTTSTCSCPWTTSPQTSTGRT